MAYRKVLKPYSWGVVKAQNALIFRLNLYTSHTDLLKCFTLRTHSPFHTPIHRSVGNLGLNVLQRATLTYPRRKLESNLHPSYCTATPLSHSCLSVHLRCGSWFIDSSLSPLHMKLPFILEIVFAGQSSLQSSLSIVYIFLWIFIHFYQLSTNILWYTNLWRSSLVSHGFLWHCYLSGHRSSPWWSWWRTFNGSGNLGRCFGLISWPGCDTMSFQFFSLFAIFQFCVKKCQDFIICR